MQVQKFLSIGIISFALQAMAANSTSFLGVGLQEIGSDRAKELKLPEEAGVEITSVEPNSPAAAAGLRTGDVVLQYNGQRVEGTEQFSRMVQETPAGREVKLQVFRGGASQTISVKIGSRPAPFPLQPRSNLVFPTQPPTPAAPNVSLTPFGRLYSPLGIQSIAVEGQLADYFGVKEGVLVSSVTKGSAAEKAGIKAGDVITRIGDSKVAKPADITSRIISMRGQSTSVTLMRDHKEMTVTATLDGGGQRF